ncbi:MAG TPA: Ig-like domain-containing protein, partial [Acidimicrobiia bacterium]|nr:Ig-like domain-containing protein [Acidimicrobiia bacterium]
MRTRLFRLTVAVAALSAGLASALAGPAVRAAVDPPAATPSFTFGAAGDMGAAKSAATTLTNLGQAGTSFFLHLGDFSYGETIPGGTSTNPDPAAAEAENWCNFVKTKANLPSGYPYELVSGGHVSQAISGQDGPLEDYTACLPDQLHSTVAPGSEYGKDYYFDYPPAAPLARVFMVAAGETFTNGGAPDDYSAGSANLAWLSGAIDDARAHGIPWVFVGMAFNCVTAGDKHCEIGADLFNLLVAKKVDLVLQGHTHTYQRSKQLALGPACPSVTNTAYDADCVVNDGSTGSYTKGAGYVLVISGTGGDSNGSVSTSDPDSQYFAKLNGASYGFTKFTVSATQLSAQFVAAVGTFSDSFTIGGSGGTPGDQPPTAAGASLSTPQDTALPVTLQATDPDNCGGVAFTVVTPPAHGTLDPLSAPTCTAGTPNRISATTTYRPTAGFNGTDSFSYKANDGALDSNTATVTVTVGTPPPPSPGITFRSASSAQNPTSTTLTINRPAGVIAGDVMVAGIGIRGAPSITAPAGWSLVRTDAAGTYTTQAIYDRVVTASEPASYTWSFSGSVPAAGGISDYQGVNT